MSIFYMFSEIDFLDLYKKLKENYLKTQEQDVQTNF